MMEYNPQFLDLMRLFQQMLEQLHAVYDGRQPITFDAEEDITLWNNAVAELENLHICHIALTDIAGCKVHLDDFRKITKNKLYFEIIDFKISNFIKVRNTLLAKNLIEKTQIESMMDTLSDSIIKFPNANEDDQSISQILEQQRLRNLSYYDSNNPDYAIKATMSYEICASVIANGRTYTLPAHLGTTDDILTYVKTNNLWGYPIKRSELVKKGIIDGGRNKQFTTVLRSGLLGKGNPLAPFVDMSSHTIIIRKDTTITNSDLEKIKKTATKVE